MARAYRGPNDRLNAAVDAIGGVTQVAARLDKYEKYVRRAMARGGFSESLALREFQKLAGAVGHKLSVDELLPRIAPGQNGGGGRRRRSSTPCRTGAEAPARSDLTVIDGGAATSRASAAGQRAA